MNEIGTEIIPESGESVLLRELWLTAIGHEILTKLNYGLRTSKKGFERIRQEFKKSGIKYQLRRVREETSSESINVSEAMYSIILSQIESR
jgi:hypothetical protein